MTGEVILADSLRAVVVERPSVQVVRAPVAGLSAPLSSNVTMQANDRVLGSLSTGAPGPAVEIPCTSTGRSIIGAANVAAVVTLLGLTIGTNVQAYDGDLDAIAAQGTTTYGIGFLNRADAAAGRAYIGAEVAGAAVAAVSAHEGALDPHPQYLTADEGNAAYVSSAGSTAYGLGFLTRADATAARAYIGAGTLATQDATNVAITGGSIAGASGSFTTLAFSTSLTTGTLGYTDTGILAALTSATGGYNQVVLRNTSTATNASANFIVNNNAGTATTNYGEFGINSSTFTGSGAWNAASAVYLVSNAGPLALGTLTNNSIRFFINSGTTDAAVITSTGINSTAIGATTRSTGAFTTVAASGQITSTVATGTAPLVIASTTQVLNLNASLLLGSTWSAPQSIGNVTPNSGTFSALNVTNPDSALSNITIFNSTYSVRVVLSSSVGVTGSASLYTQTNHPLRFGVNDTGFWNIVTAGHFAPLNDNASDLATSALKIRSGYFGTSVVVGAATYSPTGMSSTALTYTATTGAHTFVGSAGNIAILDPTFVQTFKPVFLDGTSPQVRIRYLSGTYGDTIRLYGLPSTQGGTIDAVNNAESVYRPLTLTGSNVVLLPSGGDIQWGKPLVALGGGAVATLGTIGGSGPTAAAQNGWARGIDSTGAAFWYPIWK